MTWAKVDQDLCRHMVSLDPNELTHWGLNEMAKILLKTFFCEMFFVIWLIFYLTQNMGFTIGAELVVKKITELCDNSH